MCSEPDHHQVEASGTTKVVHVSAAPTAKKFDRLYIYPTVSLESSANANLTIQSPETDIAVQQAA